MDFDNVLDACLDALRAGDSIEECLSRHPGYAGQLEPLLRTAAQLRQAAPARLSADAFGHGRTALQMAARDHQRRQQAPAASAQPAQHWPPTRNWQTAAAPAWPRRRSAFFPALATAAAALILVLASALLLSTAGASLPGQTLYGAKRAVENVQGRLMQAAGQGPAWQARQLERRVGELATLHAVGMPVDAAIYAEVEEQVSATLAAADALPDAEQVALVAAVRDQLLEVQGNMAIDEPPALAVGRAIGALDMALAGQGTPAVALADAVSTPAASDAGAAATTPADATAVQSTIARATATRRSVAQGAGATATPVAPTPAAVAALPPAVEAPTVEAPTDGSALRTVPVAVTPPDGQPSPTAEADLSAAVATATPQPSARVGSAPVPAASPVANAATVAQAVALAVSAAITQPREGADSAAVAAPAVAAPAVAASAVAAPAVAAPAVAAPAVAAVAGTEASSLSPTPVATESPAATATLTATATLVATPTLGETAPEPVVLPSVTAEPAAEGSAAAETPAPEPPTLEPTLAPEATATAVVADDPPPAPPADEGQATATPDARQDSAPVGAPSQGAGEPPEVLPSAEPVTD